MLNTNVCADYPTVFGDASEETLLGELSVLLNEDDLQEVFRRAYSWYHDSKETQYSDAHFEVFRTKGGELPCYVKSLLLRFRTESDFSM